MAPDDQVSHRFWKRKLVQTEFHRRLAPETEQPQCHAVPELDFVFIVNQHDRRPDLFQRLRVERTQPIQILPPLFQFLIGGFELFVQRL